MEEDATTLQEIKKTLETNLGAGKRSFADVLAGVTYGGAVVTFVRQLFTRLDFQQWKLDIDDRGVTFAVTGMTVGKATDVGMTLTFELAGGKIEVGFSLVSFQAFEIAKVAALLNSIAGGSTTIELPSGLAALENIGVSVIEIRVGGDGAFRTSALHFKTIKPWTLDQMPQFALEADLILYITDPTKPTTRKIEGDVSALLRIPNTHGVTVIGSVRKQLELRGGAEKIRIDRIAEYFGVPWPDVLPDLTGDIEFKITPEFKSFEMKASLGAEWKLQGGSLHTDAKVSLSNSDAAVSFQLRSTTELIPGVTVRKLDLQLEKKGAGNWTAGGTSSFTIIARQLDLAASLDTTADKTSVRFTSGATGDLLMLSGIASLKAGALTVTIDRSDWSLSAACDLSIADVHDFKSVKLATQSSDGKRSLTLEIAGDPIRITLADPLKAKLELKTLQILSDGGWKLRGGATLSLEGVPQLPLLPRAADVTLGVSRDGVRVVPERTIPPFEGELPDLNVKGEKVRLSHLGKARLELKQLGVVLGKRPLLICTAAVGLPQHLDKIFGAEKPPKVFRTFPELFEAEVMAGYRPSSPKASVEVKLKNSPLKAMTVVDGVWECNLGAFGAVDIAMQPLVWDGKRRFSAKVAVKVVRQLRLPLAPLKQLLRGFKAHAAANALPDSLPLLELSLIKDGKLDVDALLKILRTIFGGTLPDKLEKAIEKLRDFVLKLPRDLVDYLQFRLPTAFSAEIGVSSAGGAHVSVALDPKTPLRFLQPATLGGLPMLQGLQLRSFSIEPVFGGTFLLLHVDMDVDQFDLLGLIGGLLLPENSYLTPSNKIYRRIRMNNLTLVVIMGTGVPIPIPLFFDELALESLGIEGVEIGARASFPDPTPDALELLRLIILFRKFFEDPKARLSKEEVSKIVQLKATVKDAYVTLPQYLGGLSLGIKGEKLTIDAIDALVDLLNTLKFLTVTDLLRSIDVNRRANIAELKFLSFTAAIKWFITSPAEFQIHYPKIGISQSEVPDYLDLLQREKGPDGIAVFLAGAAQSSGIAVNMAFGLMISGAAGFRTGFRLKAVAKTFTVQMKGTVALQLATSPGGPPSQFGVDGESSITFAGLPIFAGTFAAALKADGFEMKGKLQLLPAPLSVSAEAKANLSATNFTIHTIATFTLLNGLISGASATASKDRLELEATVFGAQIGKVAIREHPRGVSFAFTALGVQQTVQVANNGSGSLEIDFPVPPIVQPPLVGLTSKVDLPQFHGNFVLSILGVKVIEGQNRLAIDSSGFSMEASFALKFDPFLSLTSYVKGGITAGVGLLLRGTATLKVGIEPLHLTGDGRISINYQELKATLWVKPGPLPTVSAATAFMNWRGKACLLLAYKALGLGNHLAVGPGLISLGPWFPDDWPKDLQPPAASAAVGDGPEMPVPEVASAFLAIGATTSQESLNEAQTVPCLRTMNRYRIRVEAEQPRPDAPYKVKLTLHRSADAEDFLTALRPEDPHWNDASLQFETSFGDDLTLTLARPKHPTVQTMSVTVSRRDAAAAHRALIEKLVTA